MIYNAIDKVTEVTAAAWKKGMGLRGIRIVAMNIDTDAMIIKILKGLSKFFNFRRLEMTVINIADMMESGPQ